MTKDIERRLSRIEQQAGVSVRHQIRVFFEPKGHPDRAAFARQCAAEAGTAHPLVVRFVKPADKHREPLQ